MRQRSFRVNLPGWQDPLDVFTRCFEKEQQSVWLDSGIYADSGMSYIAAGSRVVTAAVDEGTITVDGEIRVSTIFDFLRAEMTSTTTAPATGTAADPDGAPDLDAAADAATPHAAAAADIDADDQIAFRLGWVGWLGYGLRAQTLGESHRPNSAVVPSRFPDAALIFIAAAVVFDHATRSVAVIGVDESTARQLAARLEVGNGGRHDSFAAPVACDDRDPVTATSLPADSVVSSVRWAHTDEEYVRLVEECQAAIWAGDAYQLCLTTEVQVDGLIDPLIAYRRLRTSSPTHHGALFRLGGLSLLSSSPELFLSVSATGLIESKPIKGTRPRGATPTEDAELAGELRQSEKEQAENLMIVDLMRNDIGRVSEIGTVHVPELLQVESYAQVHQLVSTVRGQLASGISAVDAVVSCFPAGSMTGAPKSSAVHILERLEQRERGVYSGAFGYFGLDGRVELSMVIRSIMLEATGATIGTGGGITALSVPSEELAEVKLKAAALLAAVTEIES